MYIVWTSGRLSIDCMGECADIIYMNLCRVDDILWCTIQTQKLGLHLHHLFYIQMLNVRCHSQKGTVDKLLMMHNHQYVVLGNVLAVKNMVLRCVTVCHVPPASLMMQQT